MPNEQSIGGIEDETRVEGLNVEDELLLLCILWPFDSEGSCPSLAQLPYKAEWNIRGNKLFFQ